MNHTVRKTLLCLLPCLFARLALSAQTVYVDGNPAIVDTQSGVRYAAVRAAEGDTLLSAVLTFGENEYTRFVLDGVAYAPGDKAMVRGNVAAHELVLEKEEGSETLSLALTTLPIVCIERTAPYPFSRYYDVPVRFTLTDPYARTGGGWRFESVANVSLRGATASMFDKKSYKVELVEYLEENGMLVEEERDANLLGIREADSWILDAAAVDHSRMRNRVCFDLWNEFASLRDGDMMRNGTKGSFCEIFVDGAYSGLYCLSDKVNRTLLGLKKTKLEEAGGTVKGLLYKCKSSESPGHFLQLSDGQELPPDGTDIYCDWHMKYPKENYTAECWEPLFDLMSRADGDALTPDSMEAVLASLYEDNLVEYAVFAMSVQLLDNFMHNTYLSVKNKQESGRCWITPWDMDASLGRDGAANLYEWPAKSRSVFQSAHPFRPWYDSRVQPFWDKYAALWTELHDGALSSAHVAEKVDRYTRQIEQSGTWKREHARWDSLYNFWRDEALCLAESLAEEAEYIKGWYARNEAAQAQVIDAVKAVRASASGSTRAGIYRIDGTRVREEDFRNLPHGVYIVDGQKMIR